MGRTAGALDEGRAAWREALFSALCQDHAAEVLRLLRKRADRDGVDGLVLGLRFAENARGKRVLVTYGAQRGNSSKDLRDAATALHVAVWINAVRSAKALIREGASTSRRDALGVCAFDRASTDEMHAVLRCPAAPRSLEVLSCRGGRAVLQWRATPCKPAVDLYEITEHVSGMRWLADAEEDVRIFAGSEQRGGPVEVTFETPPGSVQSDGEHRFSVRARNSDGFWSESLAQKDPVRATHWLEEWSAEHDREEREREQKQRREEEASAAHLARQHDARKHLVLGSVSFGYVRVQDWIHRARQEQDRAAATIQSLARAKRQRELFKEQHSLRQRRQRRAAAARTIQKFFKFVVAMRRANGGRRRLACGDDPRFERSRHAMLLSGLARRKHTRLSLKAEMRRERQRLQLMRECGYEFTSQLPAAWK